MITKQDSAWAAHEAQFKQQVADGLADIYRRFENLFACEANNLAIVSACNTYCGDQQVVPTVSIFQQILDDNPDFWKGLATSPPEKQKARLFLEIEELLRSVSSNTDADVRAELGKLRYKNLTEVLLRRNQLVEKHRLAKLSVPAIRKELAASRPKLARYHPYQTLDPQITPTDLNRILRSHEARTYLRKYGADQLNDRIFGRS